MSAPARFPETSPRHVAKPYAVTYGHAALPLDNPKFDAAIDAAAEHCVRQFAKRTGLRDGSRSELLAWWSVEFERVAGSHL